MAEHYEVVVAIKGAGRKEHVSPTTYAEDDAQAELEKISEVQEKGDGWLKLPWLNAKGADIVTVHLQPVEEPRPAVPQRSTEELIQEMSETFAKVGLKIVPIGSDEPAGGHEDNG